VHPLSQMASRAVHKRFVVRFCAMLPPGCRPIVITDAGFRSPWFQLIEQSGWHFLGRIRNRDMVRPIEAQAWTGCKQLYAKASSVAQALRALRLRAFQPGHLRALAVGCLAHALPPERTGAGRPLRAAHANRGSLPRREKRALRSGLVGQSLHAKAASCRFAVDRRAGLVCPAINRRSGQGATDAVSVPEQHPSISSGALDHQPCLADRAKRTVPISTR
jgi:hypothetical protein